jgi:tRNA1Val (adenine37-N6)-methyltransferase
VNGACGDSISLRGAGIVSLVQPDKGNRFTLDSLLLADFCRIKPRDNVLEPGTGTGIVSILLAKKFPHIYITAVEIQPEAAACCRLNIVQNGLNDRITLLEQHIAQLKKLLRSSSLDVIVANPPYTRSGSGRQSPQTGRLVARHEHLASLDAWFDLQVFLKNKGKYILVFPADRFADVIMSLRTHKLEPKRVRFVHPHEGSAANIVLIEAVKSGGPGMNVLPPFILHEQDNRFSQELMKLYGPSVNV